MPKIKPITEKQLAANRRNAQKSTGPRTKPGKQRAAANSWKHGLTASHTLISVEERAEFEAFRATLIAEHRPAGAQELMLVTQIANSFWRIQRIQLATVGEFDRGLDEDESATTGMSIANTMVQHAHAFDLLGRYEATANSVYFRALNILLKLQAIRRKADKPQNGFVSQSATQIVPKRLASRELSRATRLPAPTEATPR